MARVFGMEAVRMPTRTCCRMTTMNTERDCGLCRCRRRRAQDKFGNNALRLRAVNALLAISKLLGLRSSRSRRTHRRMRRRLNQLCASRAGAAGGSGLATPSLFRHLIYAPGEYYGVRCVVIPGVNEALDKGDSVHARQSWPSWLRR